MGGSTPPTRCTQTYLIYHPFFKKAKLTLRTEKGILLILNRIPPPDCLSLWHFNSQYSRHVKVSQKSSIDQKAKTPHILHHLPRFSHIPGRENICGRKWWIYTGWHWENWEQGLQGPKVMDIAQIFFLGALWVTAQAQALCVVRHKEKCHTLRKLCLREWHDHRVKEMPLRTDMPWASKSRTVQIKETKSWCLWLY